MLKKKGFKGYTSLKKAELERLLESGSPSSSASKTPRTPKTPKTPKGDSGAGVGLVDKKPRKPRVAKPKPFVPAEVKGDSPVPAENAIPKIIFPNKPPVLKPSRKSAMESFFGGLSLVHRQLPNAARLPAPNMMLNMAKMIEGRISLDAPLSSARKEKPPTMRGVRQYV
jgi:hypothetical protein